MPKLLNIEVGGSFVKICLTEKKKNSVILKKAFMVETPAGTAADGVITDPALLGSAITPKLHENGMSGVKNVIFTIVSGKVATREVMLPPVKENRIKSVIESNSSEYFPVDISRYLISYGMLKTVNEGNETGSHLTAIAAPLQLLDGYIRLAEKMNLDIQGIDYGGNSQFQVIKALGTKKVTMCIMVTGSNTYIMITRGDRLILHRTLPWGGSDYIETYLDAIGEEDGDYEKALKTCSSPLKNFLAADILSQEDINRALNRIVGGISRSMDFFNSSRWSTALEDIILAGPCANLAGLKEAVSTALGGIDVFSLEEFPPVLASGSALQGNPALISQYISAYGSAFAPVDLIPDKYKATKEKKKSSEHGIVGAIVIFSVCVIAGVTLSLSAIFENNNLQAELDEILQDINTLMRVESEYDRQILFNDAVMDFMALEEANDSNNKGLVEFFAELEEKMPSSLLLLSAVCTNDGVIMNIRVPSKEAAAMTITQFRTFESVRHLEISALSQGRDEAGFDFYTFTINCLYNTTSRIAAIAEIIAEEAQENEEE
jgi:type IV pilus assembly protein PilM